MKALILNSGIGSRMGDLTNQQPKCMTEIGNNQTILSRQLELLADAGISEIVMTTGKFDDVIKSYCQNMGLPLSIQFVCNPMYDKTNYIYSIFCAREFLDDDILLLHGDLVFEKAVLQLLLDNESSCVIVSETAKIPEKDFKAVISEGKVVKIGINYFDHAIALQPMYRLNHKECQQWLGKISEYCEKGKTGCYAEDAFNDLLGTCEIWPLNVNNFFCQEIDTKTDLEYVQKRLAELKERVVYISFSTELVHEAHTSLIRHGTKYGRVIAGVLSDEAVASYKRFPLIPYEQRSNLFANLKGVSGVVKQNALSYMENIRDYKPDIVIHGDDWKVGVQALIREEVVNALQEYGGILVEFPYSADKKYVELEKRMRCEAALPDVRRGRLKKAIQLKGLVTAIEAHSGLTGLIAEKTVIYHSSQAKQFDAMWVSSLCDSTAKGKPDIELVDLTSRLRTIDDIMEVTTKPIIFDGDTGGYTEHFVYTVRSVERMGVSMIIIEDKIGLKKNSLFGTEVEQRQDSIENFCNKIKAGKRAQKTADFMICARIESLILEQGMEDALARAKAYVNAGADAIMIHSRKSDPKEIFEFVEKFRAEDRLTPIVVVPTSFNSVTEDEFRERGVNVVIYANQLTRSAFPAMQNVAQCILENQRALEADQMCMSIRDILTLIPEE